MRTTSGCAEILAGAVLGGVVDDDQFVRLVGIAAKSVEAGAGVVELTVDGDDDGGRTVIGRRRRGGPNQEPFGVEFLGLGGVETPDEEPTGADLAGPAGALRFARPGPGTNRNDSTAKPARKKSFSSSRRVKNRRWARGSGPPGRPGRRPSSRSATTE